MESTAEKLEFDFIRAAMLTERRRNQRYVFGPSVMAYVNERIDAGLRQMLSAEQAPQATGESQAGSKVVGGVGEGV